MAALTDKQVEFLEAENYAVVAPLGEDGAPQTSVVWIDTDGEHVVFNTKPGRAKGLHLERDPRVSVLVIDRNDWLRYLEVEGTAELDYEGANEHIEKLSQKYDRRPFRAPTDRVIVRVTPTRILDYDD
jgi:PPOX class probable F420-dependent enzyme